MGLKLNLPSLGCPATSVNLRKDVSPQIADQVAVPKWNRTGFLLDACRSGGMMRGHLNIRFRRKVALLN